MSHPLPKAGPLPKHTPGPWSSWAHYWSYCGKENAHPVASEADARLIAAAPDLLHELGKISDALGHGEHVTIEPNSVWASEIRKIVKNAEGA